MELNEILKMPDGFTPPEVTVKIDKVYDYKSGKNDNGEWSFQDVAVVGGGRLKLKGINHAFPKEREGMTVTIRANQSKQHGLTGMKVLHEEYQGNIYDKLVITSSAKWEFANPATVNQAAPSQPTPANGNKKPDLTYAPAMDNVAPYAAHLLGCAALAGEVAGFLKVSDGAALQACFATICIDTKNRGILLPKPAANGHAQPPVAPEQPWAQEASPFGDLPDELDDNPEARF